MKFKNGTKWNLGGHYKLFNADHSKLIAEHDIDNTGYWNYEDINDKLYIEEQF